MVNSGDFFERAVSIASKEFVRGFVIGQVALLLVLIVLARLLFFKSATPATVRQITFKSKRRALDATGELVSTDSPSRSSTKETCEWMNALLNRLILRPVRERLALDEALLARLLSNLINEKGSDKIKRDIMGPLEITKFILGSQSPTIRWVKTMGGEVWEALVEWEQPANFKVETSIMMCWPPSHPVASLPCSFAFSIMNLSAVVRLQPLSSPSLSVLPDDFRMDLEIHSLIGHRSKLKDVPKLTNILHGRIKEAIYSHLLFPRGITLDVASPIDDLLRKLTATNSCCE